MADTMIELDIDVYLHVDLSICLSAYVYFTPSYAYTSPIFVMMMGDLPAYTCMYLCVYVCIYVYMCVCNVCMYVCEIAMGKKPVFSERQKHIPIRVYHLKECCDEGIVELRHKGTKYQLADIGTKALPAPVFLPLSHVILGKVSFSDLKGL